MPAGIAGEAVQMLDHYIAASWTLSYFLAEAGEGRAVLKFKAAVTIVGKDHLPRDPEVVSLGHFVTVLNLAR
jgi:hypothetical protein